MLPCPSHFPHHRSHCFACVRFSGCRCQTFALHLVVRARPAGSIPTARCKDERRHGGWRLRVGRCTNKKKGRIGSNTKKNKLKKNTHTQEEPDCATCIRCRGRKNSFRFLFGFFFRLFPCPLVCVCVCEGFSVPLFWGSRLPIMQPGWGRRSKNRECIIPRWCIGPCAMGGCSFFLFVFCCASCPFDRLVRMHILLHLLAVSVFDGSGPDGVVFQPGPGPVLPRSVLFGVRSFSFFLFFLLVWWCCCCYISNVRPRATAGSALQQVWGVLLNNGVWETRNARFWSLKAFDCLF